MPKIHDFLLRTFTLMFSALLCYVLFNIVSNGPPDGLQRRYLLASMVLWASIAWITRFGLDRITCICSSRLQEYVLIGCFVLLLSAYAVCGWALAVNMAWDTEAVFRGASTLAQTGELGRYSEYFHQFPNNLPTTYLLSRVFVFFSLLGISNFQNTGIAINVFALWASAFMVYLLASELGSRRHAGYALALFAACLPIYFYTPIFYTDTLSMPFAVAVPILYLRLQNQPKWYWCVLLGLVTVIGALIKITVLIVAIAALIHCLILRPVRKLRWAALSTATAILVFFSIQQLTNPLLDAGVEDQRRIPHEHWILMGLQGNGGYNPADYEFTKAFPTFAEKRAATRAEIQQRIAEKTLPGTLKHLLNKASASLSTGHYAVSDMIDDGPLRNTWLHQVGLANRPYHQDFLYLTQSYHLWLLLFLTWPALKELTRGPTYDPVILLCRGAVFGVIAFLSLWEFSPRYTLNILPLLIVLFAAGLVPSRTVSAEVVSRT